MGSLIFKFKQPTSMAYAPGMAISGIDGDPGEQGNAGKAMYFIDYEPDNDYYKELALQRIDQNYILSKDSNLTINERPYRKGDIFITKSMSCYMLSDPAESSNYKFSLKYMGKFHSNMNNMSSNVKKLTVYNVTSSTFFTQPSAISERTTLKEYPITMNTDAYTNSEDGSKELNGIWVKFLLEVDHIDPDVEYILELFMDSAKSYVFNSYDETPLSHVVNFTKPFTTKLQPIAMSDTSINKINYLFSDIFSTGSSTDEKFFASKASTIFLSDYSFDRMITDFNMIKCTRTGDRYIDYEHDLSTGETHEIDASTDIEDYTKKEEIIIYTSNIPLPVAPNERAGDSAQFSFIGPDLGNFIISLKLGLEKAIFNLICINKQSGKIEILNEKDINYKFDFNTYELNDFKITTHDGKTIDSIEKD